MTIELNDDFSEVKALLNQYSKYLTPIGCVHDIGQVAYHDAFVMHAERELKTTTRTEKYVICKECEGVEIVFGAEHHTPQNTLSPITCKSKSEDS